MTGERTLDGIRPHWGRLRFLALATVGVLAAHDAVFAAQYGLGDAHEAAMARTVHGYWPVFVALTLLVGGIAAATAVRAIVRLRRLVRGLPAVAAQPGRPGYLAEVRRLWPRLFAVITVAFVVQENVEHLAASEGLPGLHVLSAPEYPLAIPVLLLVSGLLAVAGGWLHWRRAVLVRQLAAARIAAARHSRPIARHPHGRWALLAALIAHRRILLRRDAERAPPVGCAA